MLINKLKHKLAFWFFRLASILDAGMCCEASDVPEGVKRFDLLHLPTFIDRNGLVFPIHRENQTPWFIDKNGAIQPLLGTMGVRAIDREGNLVPLSTITGTDVSMLNDQVDTLTGYAHALNKVLEQQELLLNEPEYWWHKHRAYYLQGQLEDHLVAIEDEESALKREKEGLKQLKSDAEFLIKSSRHFKRTPTPKY